MTMTDQIYKIIYRDIETLNVMIAQIDEEFDQRKTKVKDFFILKEIYIARAHTLRRVLSLFCARQPEGRY